MAKKDVAVPETGSIKKSAWCNNCEEIIDKPISGGYWSHTYTGEKECFPSRG